MEKKDIQNLIQELLEKILTPNGLIEISQDDKNKTTWFKVEVKEPHLFLNREGEALHSLNHLVRRIIETKIKPQEGAEIPRNDFLIDINGFQKKKIENIEAMVHMMAERARYFKSSVEIDPMSAFERRIVHEFLSEANDLKTESVGFGPSRRVVIKYTGSI